MVECTAFGTVPGTQRLSKFAPFSPSYSHSGLTLMCKDYDATCQTSRGYGVRILSFFQGEVS